MKRTALLSLLVGLWFVGVDVPAAHAKTGAEFRKIDRPKVVFHGVVSAVRPGRDVGDGLLWGDDWTPPMARLDVIVEKGLAFRGIDTVPPKNGLFARGGAKDSRFEAACMLIGVSAAYEDDVATVEIRVVWQVFDRQTGRLVLDKTYTGKGAKQRTRNLGMSWAAGQALVFGFKGAFKAARDDAAFSQVLHSAKEEGRSGTGTGFWVAPDGHMLTAFHVIEGAKSVEVVCGGQTMPASVVATSPTIDAALLKVDHAPPQILPLVKEVPSQGTAVSTVGFPVPDLLGQAPKYTAGVVSATSGIQDDAAMLQITVPLQPGNSGGPLIDGSGRAVGLVVAVASAPRFYALTGALPQNIGFAVKSTMLLGAFPQLASQPAKRAPRKVQDTAALAGATCLVRAGSAPAKVTN